MKPSIDGLFIVAFALIILLGANLISDITDASTPQAVNAASSSPQETEIIADDPTAFGSPYYSYVITQGLHGFSYDQMAVDLAAIGETTILSPISGIITASYYDEYGNPTLIIENDVYRLTLLHGSYLVSTGQSVTIGEPIGNESNQGYTTDMVGNPCWGRAGCGFHTHMNVFDKQLGSNINPLDLLP